MKNIIKKIVFFSVGLQTCTTLGKKNLQKTFRMVISVHDGIEMK